METINKPQLEALKAGKDLKVLRVTGKAGDLMPVHYTTKEGVIVVKQGKAILQMGNSRSILKPNDVFLVPENVSHSLSIEEDFEAVVTLFVNSTIEFE